ncbi:hypothetical protein CHL76_11220 [Marinococcus halophilus]|uniref:hypothetical protein n=1 Tax=Marinococcus halophilus TaxID=1371 RepID=UPI0009A8300C|nr:hypothetical protein [Marinococcus halophilus]OZT79699.1 hypothetical protein CHL76_11220 [Marinococcus halophilus]
MNNDCSPAFPIFRRSRVVFYLGICGAGQFDDVTIELPYNKGGSAFLAVQLCHPAVQSIGCILTSPSYDASSQDYASCLERLFRVAPLFL